jgi:RNA polymerase-binding transcription factor DksA
VPSQDLAQTLRASLEGERDQLREQLSELGAVSYDENFADSGQVAAEQGENRTLVVQLGEALAEVERALGKLDSEEYGRCEQCGREIGEARLEAMPATRYCIDHAGR